MSPEKARVFVAEDDPDFLEGVAYMLTRSGHTVALSASTLAQALAAVDQFGELGVNVATLDGNLNDWDTSGRDGQLVLKAIREKAPGVKTVGLSGNTMSGVDHDLGKLNSINVGEVVKKL